MSEIQGFRRRTGPPGIRNYVLSIHTVECSSFVSQKIASIGPRVQSLGFPGCYQNDYAARLMVALGTHPNVGAVLLVSLGCECSDASKMADEIRAAGRPVEVLRIQQAGGTEPTIARGKEIVGHMLAETEKTPRVLIAVSDLIVGTECGGSDATSGIAANPAVGQAFDLLVDAGAAVIFEETLEMLGCDEIAACRAANQELGGELRRVIAKAESFSRQSPHFSIGPGNVTGGLTTIEEKSMGAFAKSGSRPISGIIKVAQRPPTPGLYLLDTVPDPSPFHYGYSNPNDSEGIMALISCGAQVIVFTTGRGSVIGSVISPVLKVCGNPQTYARMSGDMDVNAGRIVLGEASIAQVGREIYDRVLAVAGGEPTAAEVLGHQEYCIPYKHQDLCANV